MSTGFVLQPPLNGVSASSGSLAFCLEKRKQQLLLSQDFLTRGPWKEGKKISLKKKGKDETMPRRRAQINATSRPFISCLTLTSFLSFYFLECFPLGGRRSREREDSQLRLRLSPVSLLAAMKDGVRTLPVSRPAHPPVDGVAK